MATVEYVKASRQYPGNPLEQPGSQTAGALRRLDGRLPAAATAWLVAPGSNPRDIDRRT